MTKNLVNKPMRRPLSQLSTTVLVNRHRAHDLAIAKKSNYALHDAYLPAVAKLIKLSVKLELIKRAKAGDGEAIAYAIEREWSGFGQREAMVAAE